MKIVSAIINSLLVAALTLTTIIFILNHVTTAQYINRAAEESKIYEGVADIVSEDLIATTSRNTGLPETVVRKNVSSVVTESYIQEKSGEVTKQAEQALRGERTKIVIEFSDLVKQANAQGLAINSTDIKPVEIAVPSQSNQTIKKLVQNFGFLLYAGIVITVLLLIVALALSVHTKSYLDLARAVLISGLILFALSATSALINGGAESLIKLPENIQTLNPYVEQFAKTVSRDIAQFSSIIAIVYIVISSVLFVAHSRIKQR